MVTAFITVYNEQTWIECAVRSLLNQSLRDIEVLVIDDGSTDRTPVILDEIRDDRLRVLSRPRTGRAASLAFATTQARGKYLANLDADDESFPGRLAAQAAFLEAHPEHGWVGCSVEREDHQRREHILRGYPLRDADIRRQAARSIPFSHSAVTFRRELVQKGINYDPSQQYLIDFEFFLRVAGHCKVANLPEVFVKRRCRDESFFQRSFSRSRQNRRLARLCVRAVRQFGLPGWYYIYPLARLGYPFLPNMLKRRVRTAHGLDEVAAATA